MINIAPKLVDDGIKNNHKNHLTNPFVVLLGATSTYLVTQIISGSIVLPYKNTINNNNLLSAAYALVGGLVLLVIISTAKKIIGFKWSSLGWVKPSSKDLLRVLPALLLYILISVALTTLASKVLPKFDVQQTQEVGFNQLKKPAELFFASIALLAITPVVEETIFRGILFKGLSRSLPFWFSALVTSLIFAAAHMQWNVAIDTFALSLILCYLVKKSGSIWPSIILHAIKNTLAFAVLFILK